jgi:RecA-family ATPase
MVIGDAVPAGLLLLAGDPKAGKSLLLQDLALSVASGTPAWGSLPVAAGDALYVANEGGKHSFRDRLSKMLDGAPAPSRLDIAYESKTLGGALEAQLHAWLCAREAARLIVVDTYASVAPTLRGVDRQTEDYKALAGLAALGQEFPDVLIVLVHHTRKAEGEDVMHRISGSNGMTAATDGNAVLARHTAARRCVLAIRPRNAEESDFTLERGENLRWQVVGSDERAQLSDGRQRVLDYLDRQSSAVGPQQVATALGMSEVSARQYLSQMAASNQVVKVGRGQYASAAQAEPVLTTVTTLT